MVKTLINAKLLIYTLEAGGEQIPSREEVPFFLNYFPQALGMKDIKPKDRPIYHAHNIANHTVVLVLDSGILEPMRGDQSKWLEKELNTTTAVNKFTMYHYALYPSITHEYTVNGDDKIEWTSIFDRYTFLFYC